MTFVLEANNRDNFYFKDYFDCDMGSLTADPSEAASFETRDKAKEFLGIHPDLALRFTIITI